MNSQPANTAKLKNAYKAPKLLVYGGMAKLTTAGSGMNPEVWCFYNVPPGQPMAGNTNRPIRC